MGTPETEKEGRQIETIKALCKHFELINESIDIILASYREDTEFLEKLKRQNSDIVELACREFGIPGVSKSGKSNTLPGGWGPGGDAPRVVAEPISETTTMIRIRSDLAEEIEKKQALLEPIIIEVLDKIRQSISEREIEDIIQTHSFRIGAVLNLSRSESKILLQYMVQANI